MISRAEFKSGKMLPFYLKSIVVYDYLPICFFYNMCDFTLLMIFLFVCFFVFLLVFCLFSLIFVFIYSHIFDMINAI